MTTKEAKTLARALSRSIAKDTKAETHSHAQYLEAIAKAQGFANFRAMLASEAKPSTPKPQPGGSRRYAVDWSKTYHATGTITVEAGSTAEAERQVADIIGNLEGSMQYNPDLDTVQASLTAHPTTTPDAMLVGPAKALPELREFHRLIQEYLRTHLKVDRDGALYFSEDSDSNNRYGLELTGYGTTVGLAEWLVEQYGEGGLRELADAFTVAGEGGFFNLTLQLNLFEEDYLTPLELLANKTKITNDC